MLKVAGELLALRVTSAEIIHHDRASPRHSPAEINTPAELIPLDWFLYKSRKASYAKASLHDIKAISSSLLCESKQLLQKGTFVLTSFRIQ